MFNFFRGKQIKKANLGQNNTFYFHNEMKRWVEPGKEAEALAEMVMSEPPKPASPVSQEIQGTGLASKYVDTGFGKPGALPTAHSTPLVPVPYGIKAPSPEMTFFVPQLPVAQPETSPLNNDDAPGDDGKVPNNFSQDEIPPVDLLPARFDKSEIKLGKDPIADIFGPDEDSDQASSDFDGKTDPLDEIFGPDEGSLSPNAYSSTPMDTRQDYEAINSSGNISGSVLDGAAPFGSLVVHTPELGIGKIDANPEGQIISDTLQLTGFSSGANIEESQGGFSNITYFENPQIEQTPPLEPISLWGETPSLDLTAPFESMNSQGQDGGGNNTLFVDNAVGQFRQEGVENTDEVAHHDGTQLGPTLAGFGWTDEEISAFHLWMDERFGEHYKEWTVEQWNEFWHWYNTPVQEDYQNQAEFAGAEMSGIAAVPDDVSSGLQAISNTGIEDQMPRADEENENAPKLDAISHSFDSPNDATANFVLNGTHTADEDAAKEENVCLGLDELMVENEGQPTAKLPVSDAETAESPVTAEVRSNTESNASYSSGSIELGIHSNSAHLHEFFAHVAALLGSLTPGSEDLAKQQANCQDQMHLLMKSMREPTGLGPMNGARDQPEANFSTQESACAEVWASKLQAAEQEIATLQIELKSKNLELEEAKETLEIMAAEDKEAEDDVITDLRAELEQSYHHRLMTLQSEVETQKTEISALQASRAPQSLGDSSGQGGDLQKLRQALEEMEISHTQEITDLQNELDLKVSESDDIQLQLDTLMYRITHGLDLGGDLAGLVPHTEFHKKLEALTVEVQVLKGTIVELEDQRDRAQEEVQDARKKNANSLPGNKANSEPDAPAPEMLLASLGLAEIQIQTLSKKLYDFHVDPDALMLDAVGEFIDLDGGL